MATRPSGRLRPPDLDHVRLLECSGSTTYYRPYDGHLRSPDQKSGWTALDPPTISVWDQCTVWTEWTVCSSPRDPFPQLPKSAGEFLTGITFTETWAIMYCTTRNRTSRMRHDSLVSIAKADSSIEVPTVRWSPDEQAAVAGKDLCIPRQDGLTRLQIAGSGH